MPYNLRGFLKLLLAGIAGALVAEDFVGLSLLFCLGAAYLEFSFGEH